MCRFCAADSFPDSPDRTHVLQLLALIEHSDALPAQAALRIAGELLAWTGEAQPRFRCEAIVTRDVPADITA